MNGHGLSSTYTRFPKPSRADDLAPQRCFMRLFCLFFWLLLGLGQLPAHAQTNKVVIKPSISGLTLGPVPDVVYAQTPDLPMGMGVLVENVATDSAGFRGGLRKHDILVTFAGKPLGNAVSAHEKFAKIEAGQIVQLTLFRGGKEKALPFTLPKSDQPGLNAYALPKGFLKTGSPPAVSIQAQPMDNGKLDVTILFYADSAGKLERLHFVGPIAEVENSFQAEARDRQLPVRVVDLVDVALRRLRVLNTSPVQK